MSDSDKRMVKLENQLSAEMQKGNPDVIRRMTAEQAEYVEKVLHHKVSPYLYEIRTRRIEDASNAMWLLKEIQRAYKKGQKTIHKRLRAKEVATLIREGITFRPVKYRVTFNAA